MYPAPRNAGTPLDIWPLPALNQDGVAALHARFANIIHEHVLQALSISLLQVEMSRRLCAAGNHEEAVIELDTATQQLQAAAEVLHQLMHDLSASGQTLARPA